MLGFGEIIYDSKNIFILFCDGFLYYKFLDLKFKVSYVEKFGNSLVLKGLLIFEIFSVLGL